MNPLTTSHLTRRHFVASAVAGLAMPGIAGGADSPVARPRPAGPLADYVHRADAATRFDLVAQGKFADGEWLTGRLTSQVWQGVAWTHELSLIRPTAAANRGPMLLWIDGGTSADVPEAAQREPSDALRKLARVAMAAGLPAAVVRQVPYQPMFNGLVEDALIAHSFVEFVQTGDPTWPLLLPMVKTAVEAMSAAESVADDRWGLSVEGFVTTGASKRGWTTWLAAAADERIVGLVPVVIDLLSMKQHLGLQLKTFGRISEQLVDYTSRGIEKLFGTPRGDELTAIVDPLAYREQLVQPKIIALGTNDPYWPLEACDLYFDELEGRRWVSYAPNVGHGISPERLGGLVAAMGRDRAGIEQLPEVTWSIEREATETKHCLVGGPDAEVAESLAWTATSATRDFRKAVWQAAPAARDGGGWRLSVEKPTSGFAAGLIGLSFARRPLPLVLTTGVAVVGS